MRKAVSGIKGDTLTTNLYHMLGRSKCGITPFGSRGVTLGSFVAGRKLRVKETRIVRTRTTKVRPRTVVGPVLLGPAGSANSRIVIGNGPVKIVTTERCCHRGGRCVPTVVSTCRRLRGGCSVVMVRNTKDPTRVGLGGSSVMGVKVTGLTSTPILLIKSVSHNKMFTRVTKAMVLLRRSRGTQVGKAVVGGFHKSMSVLRPNLQVLRRGASVPIAKMIPCFCLSLSRRSDLARQFRGGRGPKLVSLTIVQFPEVSGFASLTPLRTLRRMDMECISSPTRFNGPSTIVLPKAGGAVDSLL